jgi:hypothetical protein
MLVLALSLALGFTATACSDSTSPGASIAGTYTLQSIGNSPLPVYINTSGNPSTEVVSEQIVLNADGSYSGVTRYRDTYSGQQSVLSDSPFTGYWTLSGNQIALTETGFSPTYGTITNNQLVLSVFGTSAVYIR